MRWSLFVIAHLPKKLEGDDGMRSQNLPKVQVHNAAAKVSLLLTRANNRSISESFLKKKRKLISTCFYIWLIRADPAFTPAFLLAPKPLEN